MPRMTAQMAEAFYNSAGEDAKEWLANALFYRELETIRRDKPLLDAKAYQVGQLPLYERDDGRPNPTGSGPGNVSMRGGGGWDVGIRGGRYIRRICPDYRIRPKPPSQHPGRRTDILAKAAIILSDGSDGAGGADVAPPSGPRTGMHVDIPALRKFTGYTLLFEDQFPKEVEAAQTHFTAADQETMFAGPDWSTSGYFRSYKGSGAPNILCKGFPMVEDVVFVKHPNYWTELKWHGKIVFDGQCYWSSLALLLYGDVSTWLRVKAEHLSFLETVLLDPNHPRHAFYTRENQTKARTQATGSETGLVWAGDVNLWERLQIPGCWTNEDLCHLTADVYGVFVVLYKLDSSRGDGRRQSKIYDMKTYGAYNSRHIFLCYVHDNHFQPMVPNDHYAYEFKLPRPTLPAAKKYKLVTRERRRLIGDGPLHHWRANKKTLPGPLAYPSFTREHLTRAAGYGPVEESVEDEELAEDGEDGVVEQEEEEDLFWRPATKSLLGKVKVARLKGWCAALGLALDYEVGKWTKAKCVDALLGQGVEVRMRVVGVSGGAILDEEDGEGFANVGVRVGAGEEDAGYEGEGEDVAMYAPPSAVFAIPVWLIAYRKYSTSRSGLRVNPMPRSTCSIRSPRAARTALRMVVELIVTATCRPRGMNQTRLCPLLLRLQTQISCWPAKSRQLAPRPHPITSTPPFFPLTTRINLPPATTAPQRPHDARPPPLREAIPAKVGIPCQVRDRNLLAVLLRKSRHGLPADIVRPTHRHPPYLGAGLARQARHAPLEPHDPLEAADRLVPQHAHAPGQVRRAAHRVLPDGRAQGRRQHHGARVAALLLLQVGCLGGDYDCGDEVHGRRGGAAAEDGFEEPEVPRVWRVEAAAEEGDAVCALRAC
ncbi:hypothetical protein BT67DRAFT_432904 [Trichocladium antarcticum]|uniref:Uncharacterized protein n=1 Tax=Trichocladium antarcticum TaxID=1450529 RepID=A0AAN6ZEH1_9PEZI|nr:hypothetical protein BT67DRAFT_432904 [Trichocladium antarcticum]